MSTVDDLLASFGAAQEKANLANEQRFQQGMDIFDQIIQRYEAGGTFEQATEAGLERGEKRFTAQATQSLVSSGLSSTTQAAGLSKKFQAEVGEPARLRAQDIASQRLSEAQMGKIGFIERREDVGPDFGVIAQLAQSIGQGQAASYRPQSGGVSQTYGDSLYSKESLARQAYERATETSRQARLRQASAEKSEKLAASFEAGRARPSTTVASSTSKPITYDTPSISFSEAQAGFSSSSGQKKQAYQPFNWSNVPGY